MPDQKRDDRGPAEGQESQEGRSVVVEDQFSFIDEGSRTGKQFADGGRKVTDLERVGAFSPDVDADAGAADDDDTDEPPAKRRK